MTRLRGFVAVVLGLTVVAAFQPLSAQQPLSLTPGQRVRVTAPAAGLVRESGTLEAVTADSVVLMIERPRASSWSVDTVRRAVPRAALQTLEVGARHSHALAGFAIGTVVCTVAGGLNSKADELPLAALFCSIGGGLLGVAVGGSIHTETWAVVPLDRLRVGLAPLPAGRLGLGASLGF